MTHTHKHIKTRIQLWCLLHQVVVVVSDDNDDDEHDRICGDNDDDVGGESRTSSTV